MVNKGNVSKIGRYVFVLLYVKLLYLKKVA